MSPVSSLPDNFLSLPAGCRFSPHNAPDHSPAVLTVSHASTGYIPVRLSAAIPLGAVNWSPRTSPRHMRGNIPHFDSEPPSYAALFPSHGISPVPETPRSAPSPDTADPGTSPDTALSGYTHTSSPYTPQKPPFSD